MPSEDNSAHGERQEEDNPENDVGFFVDDVPGQNAQRIVRLEGSAGAKLPPEAFGHLISYIAIKIKVYNHYHNHTLLQSI